MRRGIMSSVFFGNLAVLAATAALAHHSSAMFDAQKTITVHGTVTQFQWTNPHCWVELDVADDKGQVAHWSFEGGSVIAFSRQGWKRDSVKAGDKITVLANPLKDGAHGGGLLRIDLPDGTHLGSTPPNTQPAHEGGPEH